MNEIDCVWELFVLKWASKPMNGNYFSLANFAAVLVPIRSVSPFEIIFFCQITSAFLKWKLQFNCLTKKKEKWFVYLTNFQLEPIQIALNSKLTDILQSKRLLSVCTHFSETRSVHCICLGPPSNWFSFWWLVRHKISRKQKAAALVFPIHSVVSCVEHFVRALLSTLSFGFVHLSAQFFVLKSIFFHMRPFASNIQPKNIEIYKVSSSSNREECNRNTFSFSYSWIYFCFWFASSFFHWAAAITGISRIFFADCWMDGRISCRKRMYDVNGFFGRSGIPKRREITFAFES